ncbi:hypothetical protein [Noviherbaspirillum autotrophicum]|nr:hypothetical protein [Noviherbaspirillum autotrophicum]
MVMTEDHSLRQARTRADRLFFFLLAALSPLISSVAYIYGHGQTLPPACSDTGASPMLIAGNWTDALLFTSPVAFVAALLWRYRPGRAIGGIYSAMASAWFSTLLIHFSGGHVLAYFLFFIITLLLLLYRSTWPLVTACSLMTSCYLGGYGLQGLGFPVVAFSCLNSTSLWMNVLVVIGYCLLLIYMVAKTQARDAQAGDCPPPRHKVPSWRTH